MGNKVRLGLFVIFVNEVCVSMYRYQDYQKEKFNFKREEKRQLLNYTAYIRDSIMGPESGYKDDDDPITRVGFNFEVSRLQEFDEVAGNLKLISSVFIFWSDLRLSWNPFSMSIYQEKTGLSLTVAYIDVKLKSLWKPDISLFNPLDDIFKGTENEKAVVHEEGFVFFDGLLKTETFCQPNLKYFPFDEHECSVQFVATSTVITNSLKKTKLFDDNAKWIYYQQTPCDLDLAPSRYGRENNKERRVLVFPIKIIRRSSFLFVNIAVPLFMLSILNTVVFFIPAVPQDRLSFSIALLLSFTVYLIYVAELIPETSNPVPMIIYFLLFQFLLSAFITCSSFVTAMLNQKQGKKAIPRAIIRAFQRLQRKRVRDIELDNTNDAKLTNTEDCELKSKYDVNTSSDETVSSNITWNNISIVVDRIFLTITTIILFLEILLFAYLASLLNSSVDPVLESDICRSNPMKEMTSHLCVDNVTECISLDLIRL